MIEPEFRELVDKLIGLQPRFRRFALGLTGSMDLADDLVQSAYERALTRLHQYRPGTRIDSWMYRIIQTVHLNGIDHSRVRQRYASDIDPDTTTASHHSTAEGKIEFDRVRRLVTTLPEDQRAALLLVAVEGMSYKEASGILGIPVGTVTSRIARARAALSASLNKHPTPTLVVNQDKGSAG